MKNKYDYSILSKYRTNLMGLAMLWVMFFHSTINVKNPVLNHIKTIGYGGVDIFIMLSGFGLYYSYKKNNNKIEFYKRRIGRIIPIYFPLVALYCFILYIKHNISIKDFILTVSTLSFWINNPFSFDWYTPAIIVLYLLAPIILDFFIKNNSEKFKLHVIFLSCCIGICISILAIITQKNYLLIFTSRIPIFCVGILIGYLSNIKKNISKFAFIIYIGTFIAGNIALIIFIKHFNIYLWPYGLWWWPFIFIIIPLTLGLSILFEFISNKGFNKYRILQFCGIYSFEIYLFHGLLLGILSNRFNISGNLNLNMVIFLITFICAFLWNKIVTSLLSIIKKAIPINNVNMNDALK